MRALVTGGAGFVGSHLAARLAHDGWEVVATVRPGGSRWRLEALGVADDVTITSVDLADRDATVALAGGVAPDVVFLGAAARSRATAAERAATAAVNATSGQWLVDALPERCRAVVRLGSSTEYARSDGPMDETTPLRPRGFFGATKAAGSLLVTAAAAERGVRAVVLRAFQVYGPLDHSDRLVPRALRAARTGEVLPLTGPGLRRDWVFVADVVEACVRAAHADHLPAGQVLNVGTGRQVANEELVEDVRRVTGRPVTVAEGACAPREWDTGSWVCDPSLARHLLGWDAKAALEEGLSRCWDAERQ
ncbi:MAG TPA: NAD(P)-dependent oxidoreductase [Acidimicrobiales bacterium]|nr:NAD(P)-dependent oxidoreductase [Acidimicrobiales bacterium]